MRKYCDLHQVQVAGEYVDDGISGAKPLAERPEDGASWQIPTPAGSAWCLSTDSIASVARSRHSYPLTTSWKVPALVDAPTWQAAGTALTRNRNLSKKNAKRTYLLRGKIRCENCGLSYCGATGRTGPRTNRTDVRLYRCIGITSNTRPDPTTRCHSRQLRAEWPESVVWDDCKEWIHNPGERLADVQCQMQAQMAAAVDAAAQRDTIGAQIAEKEVERERVLTMYRRGRTSMEEADRELDVIAGEITTLRAMAASLDQQEALAAAAEAHLLSVAAMLAQLTDRVEEIERTGDVVEKRAPIDLLINQITVKTQGEGRQKQAAVTIHYALSEPRKGVVVTGMALDE